jgi:hypothetical protein
MDIDGYLVGTYNMGHTIYTKGNLQLESVGHIEARSERRNKTGKEKYSTKDKSSE